MWKAVVLPFEGLCMSFMSIIVSCFQLLLVHESSNSTDFSIAEEQIMNQTRDLKNVP